MTSFGSMPTALGELHREEVVRAAGRRAAADDDRARVLLPGRDEVVDVLNGESAGTRTPSWSSISWASGVASWSL